ncbi:hypothetical protein OK349_03840 [Sphingomonas sp. BT-65]|uniref:hypothetical protein n=1 Tax=Sphingomonas sp. BT-65 TaxID=2989821 RepID=UPI002236456B|nr:hypothetical protein [Sphingomonas sp. BT-65]MCW4460825.1 hypothetical protein [Sphingomonas sp. BT-65]
MPRKVQRRFNFTDRVRIPQHALTFAVEEAESGGAVAQLTRLELPDEHPHDQAIWLAADVVIEAWRMSTSSYFRKVVGSVKDLTGKAAPLFEAPLDGFEGAAGISFRLKIVDKDDRRLLAEADKITSDGDAPPADRAELIVVRPEDLGELPWMIDWSEEDAAGPVVLVNREMVDHANYLTHDPALAGAIVPQVFREVLFRLCLRDDLQQAAWGKKWIEHVSRFHDEPIPQLEHGPSQLGLADKWVREAAVAFAARYKLTEKTNERLMAAAEA